MEEILTFEGCNYFRQRLVLATLSSKAVRITKLRKDEENPGLRGEKDASLETRPFVVKDAWSSSNVQLGQIITHEYHYMML